MDNTNQEIPLQPQSVQSEVPSQTAKPSSHWLRTLSISFGIIGIGIIIGIGGFMLGTRNNGSSVATSVTPAITQPSPTPTPDPTANWQTYTNSELGLSFRYPLIYLPKGYKGEKKFKLFTDKKNIIELKGIEEESNYTYTVLTISFLNNPSSFIKDTNYMNCSEALKGSVSTVYSCIIYTHDRSQQANLGDVPVKRFQITEIGAGGGSTTIVQVDNPKLQISASFDSVGEEIFNQILSTFKFTRQ